MRVLDGTTPLNYPPDRCRKGGIIKGSAVTNTPHNAPLNTVDTDKEARAGIEVFDFTPEGLADTPARQEDARSIVHTGNS
jgi:hypothetical protein